MFKEPIELRDIIIQRNVVKLKLERNHMKRNVVPALS